MKDILTKRHQKMRSACRGASLALLADSGTFSCCLADAKLAAKHIADLGTLADFNTDVLGDALYQLTIPLAKMPDAIARLTSAGLSVAILDQHENGLCGLVYLVKANKKLETPDNDVLL